MKYLLLFCLVITGFATAQNLEYNPKDAPLNNKNDGLKISAFNEQVRYCIGCRGNYDLQPLVFVNGKKINKQELDLLDASKVKSITVLKEKESVAKYGAEGKNGVLIIEARKNWKIKKSESRKFEDQPLIAG